MASYGEPKPEGYIAPADFRAHYDGWAEGYKAGRIAALREVGCVCGAVKGHRSDGKRVCGCDISTIKCRRCRLLAEAESGEDTGEVGDDR